MWRQCRSDFGHDSFGDHLQGISFLEIPLQLARAPFWGVSLDYAYIMPCVQPQLWVELSLEPQQCESCLAPGDAVAQKQLRGTLPPPPRGHGGRRRSTWCQQSTASTLQAQLLGWVVVGSSAPRSCVDNEHRGGFMPPSALSPPA